MAKGPCERWRHGQQRECENEVQYGQRSWVRGRAHRPVSGAASEDRFGFRHHRVDERICSRCVLLDRAGHVLNPKPVLLGIRQVDAKQVDKTGRTPCGACSFDQDVQNVFVAGGPQPVFAAEVMKDQGLADPGGCRDRTQIRLLKTVASEVGDGGVADPRLSRQVRLRGIPRLG